MRMLRSNNGRSSLLTPSLNLDFSQGVMPPVLSFSRGSAATYFNSSGVLDYAPENLCLYSEQFDNVAWAKSNVTVSANTATAPDGTTTADQLTEDTLNNYHWVYQTANYVSGQRYTLTIYAKAGTRNIISIQAQYSGTPSYGGANVDLTNGSIFYLFGASGVTAVSLPNGWYKIIYTFTANATGSATFGFSLRSSLSETTTYLGNGSGSAYIWGAHLRRSSDATYNVTTSAPYYGPRLDYDPVTLKCLGLLIEEQRTNYVLSSTALSAGVWTKSNLSVSAGVTGVTGSASMRLTENTNGGAAHNIYQLCTLASATATVTISCLVKQGTRRFIKLRLTKGVLNDFYTVVLDTQTGSVTQTTVGTSGPTSSSYSVLNYGSGWYRIIITATYSTTATQYYHAIDMCNTATPTLTNTGDVFYTGDGTSYIDVDCPQLEAGTSATSYIPTTSATVTRSADNASCPLTAYNKDFATIYCEFQGALIYSLNYSSSADEIQATGGAGVSVQIPDSISGYTNLSPTTLSVSGTLNNVIKSTLRVKAGTGATQLYSGGVVANGTVLAMPTKPTYLFLGRTRNSAYYQNGYFRKVAIYPNYLPDDFCRKLSL